ncbi:MAG: HAMP domain-containing histidine kinase [Gemmatimonadaceae bacterium]|nr:HAMP domain-containing histidine kinase [Chitinophagaceae bacterium]
MNIRFKITLLFTILVTGILSLLSYSIYYFSERNRQDSFKKRLKGAAESRARMYSLMGSVLRTVDSSSSGIIPKRFVAIYNVDGQPLYEFFAPGMIRIPIDSATIEEIHGAGEKVYSAGEFVVAGIFYKDASQPFLVFFGGDDQDGKARISELGKILFFSLLAGVFSTLLVGFLFSSQLVRPINRIIGEVNEISSSNLSHRIYTGDNQDELYRLSNTFNDLLNRLQESFTLQRRFISNASHELSTPLTSISSQLQVTLHRDRDSVEYRKVLVSIQEDVEQMRQLTKSLLEIAKTGYQGSIELNEVRIDEIIFKVVSDVKKLNAAYQVELEIGEMPVEEKDCLAYGNADLLYSALKNITENGCKYSPDKKSAVVLNFSPNQILIEVKNRGDVIAEEEIEHIFHPFYRGSTSGEVKGFGLGLALASRIIGLHKGSIRVTSDLETGTMFTIMLPSLMTYYE